MVNYKGLLDLVRGIKRCEQAGATVGALALSFVCIDAMSYISMPADKTRHNRSDFIAWVDQYLRADPSQPYQYRGIDVYAARCGLLHAFAPEANLHRTDPTIYQFIYNDGGQHRVAEDHTPKVAMIGTASFFNDLAHGVLEFLKAAEKDAALRSLIESRLPQVYKTVPIKR